MKIEELKDKEGNVNIDVKIIWIANEGKPMFGRTVQNAIAANVDSEKGDGTPTAFLDIYDGDCGKFSVGDKIKITNAYTKLVKNDSGQFRITNTKVMTKIVEE